MEQRPKHVWTGDDLTAALYFLIFVLVFGAPSTGPSTDTAPVPAPEVQDFGPGIY